MDVLAPNGWRYWACGRDADSLDGQKNVWDAENAQKAAPYPQVQCTLCWAVFDLQLAFSTYTRFANQVCDLYFLEMLIY